MKKAVIFSLIFLTLITSPKIMAPKNTQISHVIQRIKDEHIRYIQFDFIDITGKQKSQTFSTVHALEKTLINGTRFDGSSINYASITNSDLLLKPDLSTFVVLPWTNEGTKTASIICNVYLSETEPHPACTRQLLQKAEADARQLGYVVHVSPELEFSLFTKTPNQDHFTTDNLGYCAATEEDSLQHIKQEIFEALIQLGIIPEKFHHEVAPSQHEITIQHGNACAIADQVMRVKMALTAIAHQHNLIVTFMPKPMQHENGNGMHINYSLFDLYNKRNIFYDQQSPYHLSSTARQFIAGNLNYIKACTAIFNSTINSYKRLVKGYEAPIYVCWGSKNRSALIRIPIIDETEEQAARAELRSPDSMCNIYLAFATLIQTGLAGITNNLKLDQETFLDLFHTDDQTIRQTKINTLPLSLEEALTEFIQSAFLRSLLGTELHDAFITLKAKELEQFNHAITDWELRRYL